MGCIINYPCTPCGSNKKREVHGPLAYNGNTADLMLLNWMYHPERCLGSHFLSSAKPYYCPTSGHRIDGVRNLQCRAKQVWMVFHGHTGEKYDIVKNSEETPSALATKIFMCEDVDRDKTAQYMLSHYTIILQDAVSTTNGQATFSCHFVYLQLNSRDQRWRYIDSAKPTEIKIFHEDIQWKNITEHIMINAKDTYKVRYRSAKVYATTYGKVSCVPGCVGIHQQRQFIPPDDGQTDDTYYPPTPSGQSYLTSEDENNLYEEDLWIEARLGIPQAAMDLAERADEEDFDVNPQDQPQVEE